MKTEGLLQVYTGDGKGKTTAALGLALRAAGAGRKVFIAQFLKGTGSAEIFSIKRLRDRITLKQYGRPGFVTGMPSKADMAAAGKGIKEAERILKAGKHDMVILDEANMAVHIKLFSVHRLLKAVASRARHVEAVVTGRNAHPRLISKADLVTEMREIKHYFRRGVRGRKGIET